MRVGHSVINPEDQAHDFMKDYVGLGYRLAYRTAYRPLWGSIVQIPTAVFTVRKDGIGRRGKELQCSNAF